MGNCGDCRKWERRTSDSTAFGWCRELSDVKGDVGVILLTGGWDSGPVFGEKVFTSQEFGCVQFEAKG